MTSSKGWDIRADSKSETIVRMRDAGVKYSEIAKVVGSSKNSCTVLYWKRKNWTRRRHTGEPALGGSKQREGGRFGD